jgi:hypothetical protein
MVFSTPTLGVGVADPVFDDGKLKITVTLAILGNRTYKKVPSESQS